MLGLAASRAADNQSSPAASTMAATSRAIRVRGRVTGNVDHYGNSDVGLLQRNSKRVQESAFLVGDDVRSL
jgi:hypothetical protein